MRSCNWIVLILRLSKFIGSYSIFQFDQMLKAAWKGNSCTSVLKSFCKNTPPRRLTASFPLVCDYIAGKPVVVSRYVGCFLRLVRGGGGGEGGTGYLRSNISPFHYVFIIFLAKWRAEKKTAFLPAGYPEDISGLMEVSREFARN